MFGRKTETPFSDWPETKPLKDGGFHVTGRYLHPRTPGAATGLAALIGIVVFLVLVDSMRDLEGAAGAALLAFIVGGIASPVLRSMLHKNLDIKVYPDRIQVGGRWGYKNYPRNVRMEFRVEQHRKARDEAFNRPQATTYRQAVEAVLQYGERRVVIAEMREKDIDKAHALAFRLQAICESQNEALRRLAEGQSSPIEPAPKPAGPGEFGPEPDIR